MLFSLQADIETLRDELEFKNHKIDEYENMLQGERHRVKDLGQELQVLNPYQYYYYYYYYYYCLVTIFSTILYGATALAKSQRIRRETVQPSGNIID